jgi:hypothetical protein
LVASIVLLDLWRLAMAEEDNTLSYTFRGSKEELKRLRRLISKALEEAVPPIDPGGPIEDWGQRGGWVLDIKDNWPQKGGWYLTKEGKRTKVRPEEKVVLEGVKTVTETVVQALNKAKAVK